MKRLLIIDYRKTYPKLGNYIEEVLENLEANYRICTYHQYENAMDIYYDLDYPYVNFISHDACLLTKFMLECGDVIQTVAHEEFVYE
jgi:hypothetical protein